VIGRAASAGGTRLSCSPIPRSGRIGEITALPFARMQRQNHGLGRLPTRAAVAPCRDSRLVAYPPPSAICLAALEVTNALGAQPPPRGCCRDTVLPGISARRAGAAASQSDCLQPRNGHGEKWLAPWIETGATGVIRRRNSCVGRRHLPLPSRLFGRTHIQKRAPRLARIGRERRASIPAHRLPAPRRLRSRPGLAPA
jgi:hypothetical protein